MATASRIAPSRPSSSSTGGLSWVRKLRTSPSSRRSRSRRNRSSVRAIRGSESKTRSMNSTWKMAFDSAWAGPSWTSCASRAALGFLGLHDPHLQLGGHRRHGRLRDQGRIAALEEQPGRLEVPDRQLEAGQLALVEAQLLAGPFDVAAHGAQLEVRGADLGGFGRQVVGSGVRIAPARDRGGHQVAPVRLEALQGPELVTQGQPVGHVLEVNLAVAVANARAACSPRRRAPPRPRREARPAGGRPLRCEGTSIAPSVAATRPMAKRRSPRSRCRRVSRPDNRCGRPARRPRRPRRPDPPAWERDLPEAGSGGVGARQHRRPPALLRVGEHQPPRTEARVAREVQRRPSASRLAGRGPTPVRPRPSRSAGR